MNLNRITITGADDSTEPSSLLELTGKFPFVEWGILFSRNREGEPSFPTRDWRNRLSAFMLPLSAHLCGWWSVEIMEKGHTALITGLPEQFSRVQINYVFSKSRKWNFLPVLDYAVIHHERALIFQFNPLSSEALYQYITDGLPENIFFLYDSSGGRGTLMETIGDPVAGKYTGYSGGINTENIGYICKAIHEKNSQLNCWIDLQSGVRTNDVFDLLKVENILSISDRFVNSDIN